MKIKKSFFFFLTLMLSLPILSQTEVDKIVEEGIVFHDKGDYKKAIETYKKALKINPKSTLVNYELSLSHFKNGNYEEAIKYADDVIKEKKDHLIQAYITKGSALDLLGKTKESIKLFEKALKKDEHYLLYYNLALNHYKLKDFDKAEENTIKAIEKNPNHSSSHLMLAMIEHYKKNKVQSLLASYYFLLLEPDSQRSNIALQIIDESFKGNVSKDDEKPNNINITFSPKKDDQFNAAELMISMLEASKSIEKNKDKTEDQMFIENTDSFFTMMGELRKKKNTEIWWSFYTNFFYKLAKSEHMEIYCKYITQKNNKNSEEWLSNPENNEKYEAFNIWLQEN